MSPLDRQRRTAIIHGALALAMLLVNAFSTFLWLQTPKGIDNGTFWIVWLNGVVLTANFFVQLYFYRRAKRKDANATALKAALAPAPTDPTLTDSDRYPHQQP